MGNPDGLRETNIPLEARIVCLADAVDAMVSLRPNRKVMEFYEILAEFRRCSGSHFDPGVVSQSRRLPENWARI
jgi:HD-GYP domain-containing protein (c-di-GMP phosphodiesterase class II)